MRFALCLGLLVGGCAHDGLGRVTDVEVQTHVEDWRDQVIYQLVVDRFANGDARNDHRVDPTALARYQGGDWQGVIDRLDYLEALGVTALWISPLVLNVDTDAGIDGYHGYWAIDLTRVNPHFGDLATLRAMVDEAHARGMLVILDIVTNHMVEGMGLTLPNGAIRDKSLETLSVEEVYARITDPSKADRRKLGSREGHKNRDLPETRSSPGAS